MNAIDDVAHVVSILMLRTHFLMNMKLVRNARLIRVSMQPIVLLDECDVQFLEAKTNDVMDVSFFFFSLFLLWHVNVAAVRVCLNER